MRRDPPYLCEHVQHNRAARNDPLELAGIDQLVIEAVGPLSFLGLRQELGYPSTKFSGVQRLAQIVAGSVLNSFDRGLGRILAGHEHYFRAGIDGQNGR